MATCTAIYPIIEGLTGGLSVEDESGGKYTHVYQVEFDDTNDSHWAALAAESTADPIPDDEVRRIPEYGEQHPEDSTSLVVEKTCDPLPDDPSTWRVTVRYSIPKIDASTTAGPQPPSNTDNNSEPPQPIPNRKRLVSTWTRQRAFQLSYSSAPGGGMQLITNSAGDPFSPPITDDEELVQITFVRSQLTFDLQWKMDFEGYLNDREFKLWSQPDRSFPKWSLKVASITADEVPPTDKTPGYWTVTIVIMHNPYLWTFAPLDQGGRELVGGVKKKIMQNGVPVVALLNGSGGKLADGGTPVFLDGIAPATKGPFRTRLDADFRWLALQV